MFHLFKSKQITDPNLGVLTLSKGKWQGNLSLNPHGTIQLLLSGNSTAPDPASLKIAYQLPTQYQQLKQQIETSLFDHYQPYQEAESSDELPENSEPFPNNIKSPAEVWNYVSPVYVRIGSLRGSPLPEPTIEIAYTVSWDEEHTVGARIQGEKLFELCGSV
jgi:hypothetical protein